ncbi:YdcF family protein [Clostridium sardiniense]|uniref:YdcF family protein n=1 Tax=Clostridium sardiniense TaxID=29369 RepID=UPI003D34E980
MNILLLILGIICLVYFAFVNLVFGYTTFSSFYLVVGLIMIVYYFSVKKLMQISWFKEIIKPLRILLIVGIIIFIVVEGMIIMYPKKSVEKSDYVLVLGAGIRGENLTTTLRDRLNAAIKYMDETNFKGDIIVSGGQGPGESITEAEAMRRYLVKEGINNDKIILENKSTNTFQNFKYTKEKVEDEEKIDIVNADVTVITTDFHALRSSIIAKRNGYENIKFYSSNTEWYLVPSMYAREFFAFFKSLVFDR